MTIMNILTMVAGVTLLLFGMDTMGKGLEKLAGGNLQKILKRLTSNPLHGLLLGLGVTAIIQSSGATTVLVIGFVNSGIMELGQTVGVIMGARIGSTVTAWLLSLTGVEGASFFATLFNPSFFGPILGIIGIALRMWSKKERQQYTGSILLGFAVLMTGMSTISGAVKPLSNDPAFTDLFLMFSNPVLGVVVGFLAATVLQSSSASTGVLQALSATGVVTMSAAIPIILGMNIGSCTTGLIAAIGANRDARRVSLVSLYFSTVGALIFFALYLVVNAAWHPAILDTSVNTVSIALIHSLFNIFSTIILLPFKNMLVRLACLSVRDHGEKAEEPVCLLDERLFSTPAAAVSQSRSNVLKMADESHASLISAIAMTHKYDAAVSDIIERQENDVDHYEDVLGTYLVHLSGLSLSAEESREVSGMLHVIGDLERLSDHAVNIAEAAKEMMDKSITFSDTAWREVDTLTDAIAEILDITMTSYRTQDMGLAAKVEPLEQVIDDLTKDIRARHIERLRAGQCTIELGFILTDLLGNYERISDHCSNIAVAMIELAKDTFDTHEYLNYLKDTGEEHFKERYESYRRKYALS